MYQLNVYAEGLAFHSFKKVMTELGAPYNQLEVASYMTWSKGYFSGLNKEFIYTHCIYME